MTYLRRFDLREQLMEVISCIITVFSHRYFLLRAIFTTNGFCETKKEISTIISGYLSFHEIYSKQNAASK